MPAAGRPGPAGGFGGQARLGSGCRGVAAAQVMASGPGGRATVRRERPDYRAECRTVRFRVRFWGAAGNVGHDDPPPEGQRGPFSRYRALLLRQGHGNRASGPLVCVARSWRTQFHARSRAGRQTRLNKPCVRFRAAPAGKAQTPAKRSGRRRPRLTECRQPESLLRALAYTW